ncbi:MAG: NlpC/P60 family protein [Acidibacillus sp.]|uniref:NlpC/P60 domain-containing protein n=1 Tax=Sulfoacidibacillus ferrooxidans TaxID=2005001 RepID=A0A9X1V6X4_9BACL|nr:NlpC/P60 family protein [Sulfoacidibacillus ferrooxidans]MCI0181910.1 hypothetical protein [Sulfoacidibacillus ferrooxidans]MCY0892794.1 NlpC/P60 family protein [Acidibacillus sp.]
MRISTWVASLSIIGTAAATLLLANPAFASTSSVIMKAGVQGPAVATLKTDLKVLHDYPKSVKVTDYYGPRTAHAVIEFKKERKLGSNDAVTYSVFDDIKSDAAHTLGEQIVQKALTYLGDPYVWGGTSPSGFDCSGFAQYVYKQFGMDIPRTAAAQATVGTYVAKEDLQPGDLVFFHTMGYGISHVGIYMGNGLFVDAASTDVEIDNINNPYYWSSRYVTARSLLN